MLNPKIKFPLTNTTGLKKNILYQLKLGSNLFASSFVSCLGKLRNLSLYYLSNLFVYLLCITVSLVYRLNSSVYFVLSLSIYVSTWLPIYALRLEVICSLMFCPLDQSAGPKRCPRHQRPAALFFAVPPDHLPSQLYDCFTPACIILYHFKIASPLSQHYSSKSCFACSTVELDFQ